MKTKLHNTMHTMASDLYEMGDIDATTMRKFDEHCLPKIKLLEAADIQKLRMRENVSQGVFAKYLNISKKTVQCWEHGDRHPSGAALRLLNLIHEKGLQFLLA